MGNRLLQKTRAHRFSKFSSWAHLQCGDRYQPGRPVAISSALRSSGLTREPLIPSKEAACLFHEVEDDACDTRHPNDDNKRN